MNRLFRKLFWVTVFMVIPVLLYGCDQGQVRLLSPDGTARTGQLSKEEFREALNSFKEFADAAIAQSANQLDQLQPDFKTRKMNMIQRTRLRHAFQTMFDKENPIEAFIETWALSVRLTNYLKDGEGSNLFGKRQDIAITAAEKIEVEIERIGRRFLKEDTFAKTQKKINNFARANPITGTFSNTIIYVTKVDPGKPGLFDDVVSIPMSPFKAMTGVDRTASAIYGLQTSANRISDIVEGLPESAKWQLLLFLMEIKETELVESVLTSMSRFSESSVRFADSAEKLPQQLRQELSALIQEIDDKQDNLQTTLEKTEKTAAAIERTLAKANNVVGSIERTGKSVNQAASAWEKAAIATNGVLTEFRRFRTPRKDTKAKPSFNINDYRDTAETVSQTVSKMQDLTVEVRKLIESEQLSQYNFMPQKITNLMAWRIGQLIVFVFLLALAYRAVAFRFINKPK